MIGYDNNSFFILHMNSVFQVDIVINVIIFSFLNSVILVISWSSQPKQLTTFSWTLLLCFEKTCSIKMSERF